MNWFKRKSETTYPDFWRDYLSGFEQEQSSNLDDAEFVVFDTETTGFDFNADRILSIGALKLKGGQIAVNESLEVYLKQTHFDPKTAEIHGLISQERTSTLSEEEATREFIRYIGNAVLVAHHADFDCTMINRALARMGLPSMKNRVLDTVRLYKATRIKSNLIDPNRGLGLDEIAEKYDIDVQDRHTASGDAMITAIIFLKTMSVLRKKGIARLDKLQKL